MTTQNQTTLQKIWQDLLSGVLTPEQARRILPNVRSSTGQTMSPESIESFLQSAQQQRQQGLASGAAWAQQPTQPVVQPISGPIPLGPNRDAQGNPIVNQGPLPEETNAFGGFQRGLAGVGLNAGIGGGEFGNYLRGRFAPTNAAFLGRQALGDVGSTSLEDFSRQTRGGTVDAGNTFQGLLNLLRGGGVKPESPISQFLEDYGPGADLAREAARERMGGYAASRLLPSSDELVRQFRAGPTGAQNTDFLAYLQRALGL